MKRSARQGHSLLEVLVATGVFIAVALALQTIWVMYSRSLAKSAEVMSANSVARSMTEGLTANGWDWLKAQETASLAARTESMIVERRVRSREANIHYRAVWSLQFNTAGAMLGSDLSEDICLIDVTVHWRSDTGDKDVPGTDFNNEARYSSIIYRHGI